MQEKPLDLSSPWLALSNEVPLHRALVGEQYDSILIALASLQGRYRRATLIPQNIYIYIMMPC